MLIDFRIKNFRSIKDEVTLSMLKSSYKGLEKSNTFTFSGQKSKLHLLRSAAIYGPNAGGKSNIIKAFDAMQKIVLFSYNQYQRGDKLPIEPFLLDSATKNQPSEFDIMFIHNGVQYNYGFSADANKIYEEWLYAYPKGTAQKWFHRKGNNWTFGSYFRGNKKLWSDSTRENALFLSTAINMNSEMLQPIYDWFKGHLHILSDSKEYWHPVFTYHLYEDERYREKILEFLKVADTDIEGFSFEEIPFDPDKMLPDDIPDALKKELTSNLKGKKLKQAFSIHTDLQGKTVRFTVDDHESDGTKKFISFIGPWIDTLENGNVMVIDELNDNFHPLMVKFLIQLFHDPDINTKNAQLIFTTHETSVMNQNIFRRDQIWFCAKKNKATELYSLVEFKPRKGVTDIEKAYLSGRYKALPFFSTPYSLFQRNIDG